MLETIIYLIVLVLISAITFCIGFLFCLRAWHLHKDKIDPINVVKSPRRISAQQAILRDARIQDILNRG